jgi:hypothetical protein
MDPTTRFAGLASTWLFLVVLLGGLTSPIAADPGLTTRVSVDSVGTQANSRSDSPALSATGRFVAFASVATNLVADDTNDADDIFVHDRHTHETTRVSVGSAGTQANGASCCVALSATGRFVAFGSFASNLVTGDTNGDGDIFVHDRLRRR